MANTICYKLKKPVIYNQGTRYEKKQYTFLACYGYDDINDHNARLYELNTNEQARKKFCEYYRIDINNVEYFYNNIQDEFDTRGN